VSEELEAKYRPLVTDPLKLVKIDHINFKPHPFTVGPKHIAYAAEYCCGGLGLEVLEKIPCAYPRCMLPYDKHTSDHALFVSLVRNAKDAEVLEVLKSLTVSLGADKIDGLVFVATPEKFRIEKE